MNDILWAAAIVGASVLVGASIIADTLRKLPAPHQLAGVEAKLDELAASVPNMGYWVNELISAAYDIAGKERPERPDWYADLLATLHERVAESESRSRGGDGSNA